MFASPLSGCCHRPGEELDENKFYPPPNLTRGTLGETRLLVKLSQQVGHSSENHRKFRISTNVMRTLQAKAERAERRGRRPNEQRHVSATSQHDKLCL